MRERLVVLGGGRVGLPMAIDLAADGRFAVTVFDRAAGAVSKARERGLEAQVVDLGDGGELAKAIAPATLVVNAVPGFMGYAVLKACLQHGKDVVDISFFPEDPFTLSALAQENGVTAVVDIGVAPGLSHVLVGHAAAGMDRVTDAEILVGGLPVERVWPYEYRAVFSPLDVIEEYTRPARLIEHGLVVEKAALSDLELIDFPGIGTLEAFNSDGLRTLLFTVPADSMREKTLRYPGHVEKVRMLRETGFFGKHPVAVGGNWVAPLDLTAQLLFPLWEMRPGDRDLTVMRVEVMGFSRDKPVHARFDLLDYADPVSGVHSMARATGYTATVTARMLLDGKLAGRGLLPPEELGRNDEWFEYLLAGLSARGIAVRRSEG